MTKRREVEFPIREPDDITRAKRWLEEMAGKGLQGGPVFARLGRQRRTLDQNSKLWPMLTDVSKQVEWVKDGEKCYMPPDEWKDLFTASLRKQSMAPGIDGGMVVIGLHTSRLPKHQFCDLIELIYAFGNERGVRWSEPAKKTYEANRRKEAA